MLIISRLIYNLNIYKAIINKKENLMFAGKNMAQLMQKAKKMQEELLKAQEELGKIHITGQAGAGLVEVVLTCSYEVISLKIDRSLFKNINPDDVEEDASTVEDLVTAAFTHAFTQIQEKTQNNMGSLKDMLPSGMQFPF
jgi:DNA-binding YbaB/EbfC family protein